MAGQLTVAGIGMCLDEHLTAESVEAIQNADRVFAVIDDEDKLAWLRAQNPALVLLNQCYLPNKLRQDIYNDMAQAVIEQVAEGRQVCMVSYGHPGVYCNPAHKAVALCKERGYPARMLAGISALDCMLADLQLDPVRDGLQAFEANDVLVYKRDWRGRPLRVFWQVNFVGVFETPKDTQPPRGPLQVFQETLLEAYEPRHPWVCYRAALQADKPCEVEVYPLAELLERPLLRYSTSFLPVAPEWRAPGARLGLEVVGLGRDPAKQTTRGALKRIREARRVAFARLSPAQREWLAATRADAKEWDGAAEPPDLLVLGGHPSYFGGPAIPNATLYPALSPEDYAFCELGFGPEDTGLQILAGDPAETEWWDPTAATMVYQNDTWTCRFPNAKPENNQPVMERLSLSLALDRTAAILSAFPEQDRQLWRRRVQHTKGLDQLLERTVQLGQDQLFEVAKQAGIDITSPDAISQALAADPGGAFARWVGLRIQATLARNAVAAGFQDGRSLESLLA